MLGIDHVLGGLVGAGAMAALLLVTGATGRGASSPVIDAQRINIRETDGTLRMVLSGGASEPGIIVRGHEQPHPSRRSAGILFYNDEGTENGGLIFDGRRAADGSPRSGGSLTFDRYEQDQAVQLSADEDGGARHAGLIVADHPDAPMDFAAIERARLLPPERRAEAYGAAHVGATRRLFVGRADDGAARVELRDAKGRSRLLLTVSAEGKPAIAFLDENGRTTRTIDR